MKRSVSLVWGLACLLLAGSGIGQEFADQVGDPVKEAIEIRQQTQKGVDGWSAQKTGLVAEFETLTRETEHLAGVHQELQAKAADLESAVAGLSRDLAAVTRISDEMQPFLEAVQARLQRLLGEGVPFLLAERQDRIENLKKLLDDADVAVSEKFRRVMEALSIEAEYGDTLEVYQEKIFLNDRQILADILRLGRLALFFQTLDQKITGYFDPSVSRWKTLPQKYNRDLFGAFEIAAKRSSADLLDLPLGRLATQ